MNHSTPANQSGFTLIELMIVVVIIGILAAIAIPRFADAGREGKRAEADPILRQIYTLQERYRAREGVYATDVLNLEGGASVPASGRYFAYSVAAHATGFCAIATPTAEGTASGLTAKSLDANRAFHNSANCS